jgi:radical SAM protein with 4Fe4S-binding SPASM domain
VYRQQFRDEGFGYIVALSDGSIGAYAKSAAPAIAAWREAELPGHGLGQIPKDARLRAPIFMTAELTLRCNLTCSHCYISAGDERENELSTGEIKELMDRIRDFGVFFVFLTGGEPTLRADFAEILCHAHNIGLDVNVLTNATGFSRRLFGSIPDTTTFVVSVDGIDAHKKIRGNQSFAQVARRISTARQAGFPVLTNATVNKMNLHELATLYDWAERERIVLVSLDLNNVGRANENSLFLFLSSEDVPRYAAFIDRKVEFDKILPKLFEETFGGGRVYSNPFYYSFAEECIRATGQNYQGNYYLYVAANGDVYPDNFYAGECLYPSGNIRESGLEKIWGRARDLVRDSNYTSFNCSGCPIHENGYFCDFRSAVMSMNLYGTANECGAYGIMKELVLLRERRQRTALGSDGADLLRLYDNF